MKKSLRKQKTVNRRGSIKRRLKKKRKSESIWEKQRKDFYKERGVLVGGIRRIRKVRKKVEEWLKERDSEIQMQKRFERMQKSRQNRWYKEMKTIGF